MELPHAWHLPPHYQNKPIALVFISHIKLLIPALLVMVLGACGFTQLKTVSHPDENTVTEEESEPEQTLASQLYENCFSPNQGANNTSLQALDLWDRIRHGYALNLDSNKRVEHHLKRFMNRPQHIELASTRGALYLHYIVNELEVRDMPLEIALLPIVESTFDPFAYSPSRASGMWQIIPGTGKMLGLKQGWWYDGRRDAVASTHAALSYLQKLNKRFDGDWLLALAAYNSGAGTVNKAIRKNKKRGKPTDFWNLELPKETKHYVPKLIALSKLILTPDQFGLKLIELPNEAYFAEINVTAQIDLSQAALLAEISMESLYALNPGFNRWATDPDGPHRLLVPFEKANTFKRGLAAIPQNERVKWQRHTIVAGETLSHIAQTYGVSVAALKSINNLKSNSIRQGKTLMVPIAQRGSKHYSHSAPQRLARNQSANVGKGKHRVTHEVKAGDSLWKLGQMYKVRSRDIAKWNGMASRDTLSLGRKLVIWVDGAETDSFVRKLSYSVRQGDSLSTIASRFSVAINDIVRWNQISRKRYLQPGQALVLFVDVKG